MNPTASERIADARRRLRAIQADIDALDLAPLGEIDGRLNAIQLKVIDARRALGED